MSADGDSFGSGLLTMMTAFLGTNPRLLEHIMSYSQMCEQVELTVRATIEEHWSLDVCAALFVHGQLTHAGYHGTQHFVEC